MMSAAFTACSSSNNDDDGGGGTPPPPEPKAQTVTLDGEEKPIVKAEYKDGGNGNYTLYLYLSADGKERVGFELNKDLHMSGSPVDLTKRGKGQGFECYWMVEYYKSDGTQLINSYGAPGEDDYPVFTTGTLTASGSPESTLNIKLENGRVMGEDGKEHTLTISYSGTMDKYGAPLPKPTGTGTVTIDGVEKPILKAEYKDYGNGNYALDLYLSADRKEEVVLMLNKELHITGNPVNLTKKEEKHDEKWYWVVDYSKSDGTKLIDTYSSPDSSSPVFKTGTLTVSGSPESTLNIKLENGRVMGEGGKEHTLTISYSGKMNNYVKPLPKPTAGTVTIDGTEKSVVKAEYEDNNDGNYTLNLYLSADGKERVEFELNKDLHMSGSPVDLTEKEAKHTGKWYWWICYFRPDGTRTIATYGDPDEPDYPVFTTGTLTVSGSPESTINIKLENGSVRGKDGKDHTLVVSYR